MMDRVQVQSQAVEIRSPYFHSHGSPWKEGQRLHALADRPPSLTPSSNPRLGVGSHHQRLHRCALNGFL